MHKISQQIALVCGGLCLLVALALVLVGSLSSRFILEQQQDGHGIELARQLAAEVAPTLATGDLLRLEVKLSRLRDRHALEQLTVYDLDGAPLGRAGNNATPENLDYRARVSIDGNIAGELSLLMAPGPALLEQQRMSWGLLFLACLLSVFVAALGLNWGQKLAARLSALEQTLAVEGVATETPDTVNELSRLEARVEQLPLELLQAPDSEQPVSPEFRDAGLLYLHLDSLGSYVETLDENSLLAYTDQLRRMVEGAAKLYEGELSVARQFGLLVSFSGKHPSGSPVFRALSAAALLRHLAKARQEEGRLSHALSQAVGIGEAAAGPTADIYPALYNQHVIDELSTMVNSQHGEIELSAAAAADADATARCKLSRDGERAMLLGFEEPYNDLLERQHELLWRKLRP